MTAESAVERAVAALRRAAGSAPDTVARAPGRVNLIGAHVDYSGGFVLPVAIDRDVVVAARRRPDRLLRITAVDYGEEDAFALDGESTSGDRRGESSGQRGERSGGRREPSGRRREPSGRRREPSGGRREPSDRRAGWAPYVLGVAALLEEAGVRLPGADLAIAGDVPAGAGLSSSAALEVASATALLALAGRSIAGRELAALCRRAEIEWAGVRCGIMDQSIAVLGRAGHALFLDCRSLEHRHVPIPDRLRIIAVDSGVRRTLHGSAFNDRVREVEEAAARLGVAVLRDVAAEAFERRAGELPEPIRRRARHVVGEIERTRRAAEALEAGDVARVGRLMNESHASSRDDFETSIPELDVLAEAARAIDGVYGARLSGAGFGGCTVSLVDEAAVADFVRRVPEAYREATGRTATVHVCRAAAGASLVPPATRRPA